MLLLWMLATNIIIVQAATILFNAYNQNEVLVHGADLKLYDNDRDFFKNGYSDTEDIETFALSSYDLSYKYEVCYQGEELELRGDDDFVPHTVGGSITYSGGGSPAYVYVSAYIITRPREVIEGKYYNTSDQYTVQCGKFPTSWAAGDILHVNVNDGVGGLSYGEVTLTDAFYDVLNLVITPPKPSAPVIGSITQPTCKLATGSVELKGLPSTGTWTLTIYPGGATKTGSRTTITVSELVTGKYNFTVTNASGGVSDMSDDAVINQQPTIPDQPVVITGPSTPCQNETLTYSVTKVTGVTYTWTVPSGWSVTEGQGTNSITVTAGANSGEITVTPSNACGNGTPGTLTVSVSTTPAQPGIIEGSVTPCQSSSQTYSVATVTGATSYIWKLPSGWTGTSTTNSITTIAGATSGEVSVAANNTCGSGTARKVAVTVSPTPAQPGTITGTTNPCWGSWQTYSIEVVTGAISYTWTLPSGLTGTFATNSISTIADASSGNISVTANNACGPGTARTLAITPSTIPEQPVTISGSVSPCQNSSQIYSVAAITGATSYTWILPSGWTGTSTTNSITTTVGTSGGDISVTASNTCGTGSSKTLTIMTIENPATPLISLEEANVLHSGVSVGNQWYDQNGRIAGANNQNYNVTSNGQYYTIVTVSGCNSPKSNVIAVTTTGLDLLLTDLPVKFYPNPVTNELFIEIDNNADEINFEIINTLGQQVYSGIIVKNAIIQTEGFSKGIYLLKLSVGNSFRFEKIIKE